MYSFSAALVLSQLALLAGTTRGFCFARLALSAISVKTGLWSENGGTISIMLTAVGLLVTAAGRGCCQDRVWPPSPCSPDHCRGIYRDISHAP